MAAFRAVFAAVPPLPGSGRRVARRVARVARRRFRRLRRSIGSLRLGPALTIVLTGSGDPGSTRAALAAQTASRRRFEVVGSFDASTVDALLTAGRAARGTHVTTVVAGDTVSPTFVSGVLGSLERGTAVIVPMTSFRTADGRALEADTDDLTSRLDTVRAVVLPKSALSRASGPSETLLLARALHAVPRIVFLPPDAGASYRRGVDAEKPDPDVESTFGALEQIAALPPGGNDRAKAAALRAAVAPLNRALRADATLRDSFERRAATIPGFDYGCLNRGLARDLAILYAALPFSDTAANIAARRVRAAGVLVDVVSADLSKHRAVDLTADPLWERLLDEHVRLRGRAGVQGEWDSAARFCRDGYALVRRWDDAKGPYRTVYSRTMFPASHLLAARYKLLRPDTAWTAEFSDPQVRDSRGGVRRSKGDADDELLAELGAGIRARGFDPPSGNTVWVWAEAVAYALADTVLFTNEAQRDYMLGYCADDRLAARAREHAEVITHPTPPAEFFAAPGPDYPLEPGRVHVAYFGTFYPTRSLGEVVAAIGQLSPEARELLRLHVFTTKPDRMRAEADDAGLGDVLIVNGYVPFADYLALTTRFHALLVNDYATAGNHDVNPYLPAKYADYRGSGTPVWGIVEPGSVLSRLPLTYRSELGDVAGARDVLESLLRAPGARRVRAERVVD